MILLRSTGVFNAGLARDGIWRVYLGAACLFATVTLTACGGGGATSVNGAAITPATDNNAPTPTVTALTPATAVPTSATTSQTTSPNAPQVSTTSAPTTSTTAIPTTGTGIVGGNRDTTNAFDAPYNSCADVQDVNNPSDTSRKTTQTYRYSGIGGDKVFDYTFTNLPQADFLGCGLYAVREELSEVSLDGLAIEPSVPRGGLGGGGSAIEKTVSYYQRTNNRWGLAASKVFTKELGPEELKSTNTYNPVFYNRLFTLAPGQTIEQTRSLSETKGALTKVITVTQRITFVGLVTKNFGGTKDYDTCEFKVQNIAPASTFSTTKWYLVGKGILYRSETVDTATTKPKDINSITLERATDNLITVFPS